MKQFFLLATAAVSGLALFSCGEAAKEAEELIDCAGLCREYDECVDSDVDVTECTSNCENRSDVDEGFQERADRCEACLDDKACAESFPCATECAGVFPDIVESED